MSSKKPRKSERAECRRKFFELYAANYELHAPEDVKLCREHCGAQMKVFRCPVCSRRFSQEALNDPPGVTVAHVYPKSCGGKLKTLECGPCNSRLGTMYDAELRRELEFSGALERPKPDMHAQSDANLSARLEFNGGSFPITISRRAGGLHFDSSPKMANPAELMSFCRACKCMPNLKFNVVTRGVHATKIRTAILHTAYLSIFRTFGYEYILHTDTQWIRDILMSPDPPKELRLPISHIEPPAVHPSIDDAVHSVAVALIDARYKCLAAILPTPLQRYTMMIAFLPGFYQQGQEMYKELIAGLDHRDFTMEIKFYKFLPENYLADPKSVFLGHELWASDFPEHNDWPTNKGNPET